MKAYVKYIFNSTNELARKTGVPRSDEKVSEKSDKETKIDQVRAFLRSKHFGCQTENVKELLTVLMEVPANTFGNHKGEVFPVGVMVQTTHQKPRLVVSLGNGQYFDPYRTSGGSPRRYYNQSNVTLGYVKKEAVEAFVTKHSDALKTWLPLIVL